MSGIYIHIPFCRQKCYYCDFYKTVNTSLTDDFLVTLKKEISLRKNYLDNKPVETIYFGGGTPSALKENELNAILEHIKTEFQVNPKAEITFEANPDDLTISYIKGLNNLGINRLSIGIQSFQDDLLKKMNRRHNSRQAIDSIKNAHKYGIKNISADLIYGLPGLNAEDWKKNLEQLFRLPVTHLSAYHLTYHEGTPFYTWLKKGSLKELEETDSILQFDLLLDETQKHDFEHYEISNFAKGKMYSKHNTSYWFGKSYLGLGPSAHSYNGSSRSWNISNVERYIKAIENNQVFSEEEILGDKEKYNEYVLTRIRTRWGVSKRFIEENYGADKSLHFIRNIEKYKLTELVNQKKDIFTLTRKGLFISDEIMSDLMII